MLPRLANLGILHRRRLLFLAASLTLAFCGCARNRPYRTELPRCCATPANQSQACAIEKTTNYLLGIVEIDDQGWLWNRQQMDCVLDWIQHADAQDNLGGLLIFVFVHGWQHNAAYHDDYVKSFRNMLAGLDLIEHTTSKANHLPARKIVGVYVGWRGLTDYIPYLQDLTFWGRKRTAHEVGRGGLTELFLRLEDFVNQTKRREGPGRAASRLIIFGHSFGGAATYSALAPLLMERLIEPHPTGDDEGAPRDFGDLVILANPAFEAARFEALRDLATNVWSGAAAEVDRSRPPVNLVIFTSKSDAATRIAFPFGRVLATLFQSHRDGEQRHANRTAVGHYKPFITHELVPLATNKAQLANQKTYGVETNALLAANTVLRLQSKMPKEKRPRAPREVIDFSQTRLSPVAPATGHPFMVVAVSKKIIPDHSHVQKRLFVNFLDEFLMYMAPDKRKETP